MLYSKEMDLQPCTLTGSAVRLEPLSMDHHAGLCQVALEPEIWRWTSVLIETPQQLSDYIQDALRQRDAGTALPFATIEQATGRVVGSTRFGNIDIPNRRVEIGWTFVATPWQRTRINTEAKYLMLRHAFEDWGCHRVELKTDALNEKSRRAIARIGAKEEGILRSHMVAYGGRRRDSVYFSILDFEWPVVKAELERKLQSATLV